MWAPPPQKKMATEKKHQNLRQISGNLIANISGMEQDIVLAELSCSKTQFVQVGATWTMTRTESVQ